MDVIPIATVMIRAGSWVIHGAGTCLGAFVHILSRHLGGDVMNPLQKQLRVGIVPGHTVRRTLAPRLTSGGRSPKFKLPAESQSISQSLSGGRAIPSWFSTVTCLDPDSRSTFCFVTCCVPGPVPGRVRMGHESGSPWPWPRGATIWWERRTHRSLPGRVIRSMET